MTTQNAHERIPAFTVGDRLRKAREKTGLDQGAFADEIGVSRGTVSNYERSDTAEDLKKPYLIAWAMRADVPVEWLRTGEEPVGKPPEGGEALRKLTDAKRERRPRRHARAVDPSTVGYLDLDQAA